MTTRTSPRIVSLLLAIALAITLVLAHPALDSRAEASTVSFGRLKDFTWNSDTKVGRLTLVNYKGTFKYMVTRDTDCGYSTGQSGGPIPCRTLGDSKYQDKRVRVTWKRTDGGARKAIQAVVDVSS